MMRLGGAVRRPSRIALRLFTFNLLLVFVPITAVLYLDVYEARLRQTQEAGLAQQARVLAAALGDRPMLDAEQLSQMFARLERRSDARFRVYDASGLLLADSARQAAATSPADRAKYPPPDDPGVRGRVLYRIGVLLANVRAWLPRSAPDARGTSDAAGTPPEVKSALAGTYGAATRLTPRQRSVTMFSAVPVRHQGTVTGAVVASQSTFRILSALYAIRLRLFEIVVASLVVAAFLTALAAMTIVGPVTRLRRQASAMAERRGPLPIAFAGAERRDEIGALAVALGELARRTNDHIQLLQSFSADVSHELKNPLASIRTAAEMMADSESEEERRRFLHLMTRDVARLERLVSGLRDVARVEGQIEADVLQPVDVRARLAGFVDAANAAPPRGVCVTLVASGDPAIVVASRERLEQVFDNLLANAVSFSPPDATVTIAVSVEPQFVSIAFDDRGPGIPEAHLERIFDRFFTYRPAERQREHVGLGLAIARQIVESYGGTISAANRTGGGARFLVRLRRAPAR